MTKKILIIGGGAAGLSAAEAARKENKSCEITLVCSEKIPPYNRTQISSIFHENKSTDKLVLKPTNWFEDNKINLMLNNTVIEILPQENKVVLKNNTTRQYDSLIIATGANNFLPPYAQESQHVTSLRSLEGAYQVKESLSQNSHVVIIGGGLLGLEAAYSLMKCGHSVSIIEVAQQLLPKQTDMKTSLLIKEAIENAGINLYLGTSVTDIKEVDNEVNITLSNGQHLNAKLVLFSIGIRSDISLAQNAGLLTNKGISVNDKMQTSIPNIFACGDCAEHNGVVYGLWSVAIKQGTIAGTNAAYCKQEELTKNFSPWIPRTIFNSFGINIFSIGEIIKSPAENEEIVVVEENSEKSYGLVYLRDKKAIGGLLVNTNNKNLSKIIKLVEQAEPLDKSHFLR